MKIWLPYIRTGSGSDVYFSRLSSMLSKNGIKVTMSQFSHIHEIAPYLLKYKSPPAGTDIIHTNSWNAFPFASHRLPLVVTVHHPITDNTYTAYKSPLQSLYHNLIIQRYEYKSLQQASQIVCVSKFTSEAVNEIVPNKPVSTIYNFIDTNTFTAKNNYDFNKDRPLRLLFVGNLSRRKGYDLLQPIMKKLGKNFSLTVVCGLRNLRKPMFGNNVHTLGLVDLPTLTQLYRDSDVLLFPTRFEGFGFAPAEAMASGLPVVSSDNSSIPEVVIDGETGILCPTDNVDSFCEACEFFYSNPDKIREYGIAGRERVLSHFSPDTNTKQYIALYNGLLSGKK